MGTPTTKTPKAPDLRPVNLGTSGMPPELTVELHMDGEWAGSIHLGQNAKLSMAGNVTYGDSLQGIVLEGDARATLLAASIVVDGVKLTRSSAGVHESKHGNPQVFFTGDVELAVGDTTRTYQPKVYFTANEKKGTFSLVGKAFPKPKLNTGPQDAKATGRITGFVLYKAPVAA